MGKKEEKGSMKKIYRTRNIEKGMNKKEELGQYIKIWGPSIKIANIFLS
jgi:hypothetical protein